MGETATFLQVFQAFLANSPNFDALSQEWYSTQHYSHGVAAGRYDKERFGKVTTPNPHVRGTEAHRNWWSGYKKAFGEAVHDPLAYMRAQ